MHIVKNASNLSSIKHSRFTLQLVNTTQITKEITSKNTFHNDVKIMRILKSTKHVHNERMVNAGKKLLFRYHVVNLLLNNQRMLLKALNSTRLGDSVNTFRNCQNNTAKTTCACIIQTSRE
uniref:Uncharacterized protein n=1 Tax=Babesia bovis TaxID=5865 RepID=S6BKM1_BABBO|nr:hypothetical protein [Babesia bovis]